MTEDELNQAQADAIRRWWMERAAQDIDAMLPKLVEYGTGDLYAIGAELNSLAGRLCSRQSDYEVGVLFYVLGKVHRALSAARRGTPASDDTWHDIAIYAKMVLAQRERIIP
jgi:hypothetical protein